MKRAILPAVTIFAMLISAAWVSADSFRYDPHGKRDPMVPLIGQDKPGVGAIAFADITSVDDVKLEGIAGQSSGKLTAIINGELVKEDFKAGEVCVKKVTKNSVTLTISGVQYTVPLPEEGGQKE